MKFDHKILRRVYGPREFGLAILTIVALITLMVMAAMNVTRQRKAPASDPPTPEFTPSALSTATASPERMATRQLATLTETPVAQLPILTEPVPTATWFYVIPAQPTPVPTPVLPPAAPFPTSCDGPGRMNLLLIGIDGFNANNYRAARADTIILVGANFATKTAQMLSFPRDLWVQLPNLPQVAEARINTAYHYGEMYQAPGGGPGEVSAVLANTFGLRIDRYAVVNFLAFEQGVDAIGGIDLNLPRPLHDSRYPLRDGSGTIAIDFPAGRVHMDGAIALIYARIRHDSSDFNRMRRQQQVLFAIRDKLLSPETIPQLPALAQVLFAAVRTDLTLDDIALLGCLGPQINRETIQTWVVDPSMVNPTKLSDGAQVLTPNMDAISPILQNFNTGE